METLAWNSLRYHAISSFLFLFMDKATIQGGLRKHLPGVYYIAIPCTIRRERRGDVGKIRRERNIAERCAR